MRRMLALFLALMLTLLPLAALAESSNDEAVNVLIAFIKDALESEDMHYALEDGEYFTLVYEPSDDRMGDIYAYVDVYQNSVVFLASYYEDAPLERVDEIARFINMVNGEVLGTKYYILPETGTIFYELTYFLNYENLGDYEAAALIDYLDSVVADIDYDVEYFMELIGGETAENVFSMFLADFYHE